MTRCVGLAIGASMWLSSACVTTPATDSARAEPLGIAPIPSETQFEWERALPQRLDGLRGLVDACFRRRVAEVESAAVEGLYRDRPAPRLEGAVELVVTVDARGRLVEPSFAKDEPDDATLRTCMTSAAGEIAIPPPPDATPVEVTLPFRFSVAAVPPPGQ